MAAYPGTLPKPMAPGYGIEPVDQTLRTDMEVGAARVRRRTGARNDRLKFIWRYTDAQLATFRTWFDNASEAAGGAAWFTVDLAVGNTGIDTVEARFIGAPKFTLLPGMNWDVSAEVEVR